MKKNKLQLVLCCLLLITACLLPADAKKRPGKCPTKTCPTNTSLASELKSKYFFDIELVGGRFESFLLNIKSIDNVGIFKYSITDSNNPSNVLEDSVGVLNHDGFYFTVPLLSGDLNEIINTFFCTAGAKTVPIEGKLVSFASCSTISRLGGVLIYVPAMATLEVIE